jgi:hypothetical protein
MTNITEARWNHVVVQLAKDLDADVTVTSDGLEVHGRLFAFLHDDGAAVDLDPRRAAELIARNIASPCTTGKPAAGQWVIVDDWEDWAELASEAHAFVGEPHVGRQS